MDGGGVNVEWGRRGKTSLQTFSNLFLKTLTEGAVTTEAGSLFWLMIRNNDEIAFLSLQRNIIMNQPLSVKLVLILYLYSH